MHEKIIKELCKDLAPVRNMPHPLIRILPWLGITILYLAATLTLFGIREDIALKLEDSRYVFELLLAGCGAYAAAVAAAYASVPDRYGNGWPMHMATALGACLLIWLGWRFYTEGDRSVGLHSAHCFVEALAYSAVPAAFLAYMVKKGCTTCPCSLLLLIVLSSSLLSWAALRLTCYVDDVGHCCITHILPFAILGAVGGAFAHRLFKW